VQNIPVPLTQLILASAHRGLRPFSSGNRFLLQQEVLHPSEFATKSSRNIASAAPSEIPGQVSKVEDDASKSETPNTFDPKTWPPGVPYPRFRVVDRYGRAYGTGKRKTAIAQVWIREGSGNIMINRKDYTQYFRDFQQRQRVTVPLVLLDKVEAFDVNCFVHGGGTTGQAEAIRHGLSKALQNWDPESRAILRPAGLLIRDSRIVERKKPGQKKARKKFQWHKR